MSPVQQKPILHGRDHCPGGADPIPCMISGPSGDFEGVLLATGPFAYWRLGESATPWADTSGVGTPANLAETGSGTALSPDVTGALASGDDGALELNYDGTSSSGGRYAYRAGDVKDFDMGPAGEMTVCAWAKVKASAGTRRGLIVGNTEIEASGGDHRGGWGLEVVYPARTVRFTRGQIGGFGQPELYATTSGGVVVGEWNFIVGTYDGAEIKLYVNAELQDTTADPSGANWGGVHFIRIGYGTGGGSFTDSWFYGTVDEAAVWTRALSQAEISALYTAGASGAAAGWVLTTDGSGGTVWAAPTIEVEF